jgi:thiosulfate/3-mercaptopyruvate sulfurtransferase
VPAVPIGAQMHGPLVSTAWLAGHLSDEHVVVLDADMRRSGFDEAHLPGARFLDLSRLVWDGDPSVGTEMRSPEDVQAALRDAGVTADAHHVVVYARNPLFASRAFLTLEAVGFRGRAHVLDGGLGAWLEEGRATETADPEAAPGDVTVQTQSDLFVDADWILERLGDPAVALIDARPDDEYTGADEGLGGRVHPGHIPGAVQMYWEEMIDSRELPRLLPRDEVRAMFEAAGAAPGDTVVAYCQVGWRASYTYLVSRVLGYDTRFYDGSWRDWGARSDLPYVTGTEPGGGAEARD